MKRAFLDFRGEVLALPAADGADEIGPVLVALRRRRPRRLILAQERVLLVVVVDDEIALRAVELVADRVARFLPVDTGFVR